MKESTNIEVDSDVSLEIPPGTVIAYSIRELNIRKNGQFGEFIDFFLKKKKVKCAAFFKIVTLMLRVESRRQRCQAVIVCSPMFICDSACADIGLQPGTTGGIESDSIETLPWDALTTVDGRCQEETLPLSTLLNGLFPFFFSSVSWPSFSVLGSETQQTHLFTSDEDQQKVNH